MEWNSWIEQVARSGDRLTITTLPRNGSPKAALRLGGGYHAANRKHLPTSRLQGILASLPAPDRQRWSLHEWSIGVVAASSVVLAALPLLLALAGSSWNPLRAHQLHLTE